MTALGRQLEGKRCAVFSEALRVRATATGFAGYPDASVVCGELTRDPENASTVTNPTVLVEVLSPSTADYDRGEKLSQYQQIASVQHIVHVAYDAVRVVVWTRSAEGFTSATFGAGQFAALPAIGCGLDVAALFRDPLAP